MTDIQAILQQAEGLTKGKFVTQPLPHHGSWPEATHLLDKKSLLAIAAALGAQRPLLVRGEPGTGKSHFARAAAALLNRHFISTVVQPYTEYQELLWTMDFTQRLADAQLMSQGLDIVQPPDNADQNGSEQQIKQTAAELLAPLRYTSPGPLWFAFDWADAHQQPCKTGYQPEPTLDNQPPQSLVLLIDEVDKADVSLCNGLLEVLGNRSFRVPHRKQAVGGKAESESPLVILTSNSVRELPRALIRRCVLLDFSLAEGDELEAHLCTIGHAHFPDIDNAVLQAAAQQIRQDRDRQSGQTLKTGVAEYVDLLRALQQAGSDKHQQLKQVEQLAAFFFKHQPGQQAE